MKNYFCFCYLYLTDVLTCERWQWSAGGERVYWRLQYYQHWTLASLHWASLCWQPPHPALTTTITIFSMSQTRTTNQHRLTSTPCHWLKKVLPFSWLIAFFFQFHTLFFTGFCIISLIVTLQSITMNVNSCKYPSTTGVCETGRTIKKTKEIFLIHWIHS